MNKEELKPGDIIAMRYGYNFDKFRVVQVDQEVLVVSWYGWMGDGKIFEEIGNRKWYLIERPISLFSRIKKFFSYPPSNRINN